jgi:hypothetical protein
LNHNFFGLLAIFNKAKGDKWLYQVIKLNVSPLVLIKWFEEKPHLVNNLICKLN